MNKDDKNILKYFLNKGRGRYAEAYTIQTELGIKESDIGSTLGSCIDHKYLWYSPSATGHKYDQYGITETGLQAIETEIHNEKNFRYQKITIGLVITSIITSIIIACVGFLK